MSYFIHALELVTAVLFVVLAVQLKRCYQLEQRSRVEASQPEIAKVNDNDDVILVAERSQEERAERVVPSSSESEAKATRSAAILNDYIGEFFDDAAEPALNIEEFKAPASEKVVSQSVAAEAVTSQKVPSLQTVEHLELEESLDDIITVVEREDEKTANVMSEKVVHAMLDEAKMVCAS